MVTIKQIEAFYSVAHKKGVRPAAEELNATESAISKRLQELEETLNVELFSRGQRRLQLTDVGAELLVLSGRLLEIRRAIEAIAATHDDSSQTLRFGMTELAAGLFLPRLVEHLRRNYPRLRLIPIIGLTDDLHNQMANNEVDILISPTRELDGDVVFEPLFISKSIWVCSRTFDIPHQDVDVPLLSQYPIIIQPVASRLHQNVMHWFNERGVQPNVIIPCNNLPGLKELAKAGVGVAPLPQSFCAEEIATGSLRQVDVEQTLPPLHYGTIYRRNTSFRRIDEIVNSFRIICVLK
jgi:DNA-binding transcriptional LysR family regulator